MHSLDGKNVVVFKHDTGVCARMPYMDLSDSQAAVIMVQTLHNKFKGYTKRKIEDAKLARKYIQDWCT